MKKFITRNGLMVLMLLVSTLTFAQGDFGDENDIDPIDAAPIGDYIWVLALIGLGYVFYKMRNRIQSAN